jgi:hypothetical protein
MRSQTRDEAPSGSKIADDPVMEGTLKGIESTA